MSKRVLVACECSQVITIAMRNQGGEAYSCDLEDCYGGHREWHIRDDVRNVMYDNWDLVIAHPPCTYLSKIGAQHLYNGKHTIEQVLAAKEFFMLFTQLGVPTCIENPIPMKLAGLPRYSQLICPSQFGHRFTKKTALWLYGLPPLLPMVGYYVNADSWLNHCNSTAKRRSRFWEGIANAMAAQWLPII